MSGLKILVVEDNLINQRIAHLMLEKMGATVTVAGNGRLALETLQGKAEFDLILMDIQMPYMDGFETTSLIRNGAAELRHIPIIALTASATAEERDMFIEAGMNELALKPYTADYIAKVILNVLAVTVRR